MKTTHLLVIATLLIASLAAPPAPAQEPDQGKIGIYVEASAERSLHSAKLPLKELESSANDLRKRLAASRWLEVTESPEAAHIIFRVLYREKERERYVLRYELDASIYVARGEYVLGGEYQGDDGIRTGFYRQGYNGLSGKPIAMQQTAPESREARPGWSELAIGLATSLDVFAQSNYEHLLQQGTLSAERPFVETDVTFPSGDLTLSGTLVTPPAGGPHPALVVVHGSGEQTRYSHRGMARDLASRGFAVLSYDKRGVGGSSGTYVEVGVDNSTRVLSELADDATAAMVFLTSRPNIRRDAIGLLGLSQGGWVVPIAAQKADRLAFSIILSGPAVSVGEEIYYSELAGNDAGHPSGYSQAELSALLTTYDGPRGFEPMPYLQRLAVPTLWVFGARDRSIPVTESFLVLDRLRQKGNPFQLELFDKADHELFDIETGIRVDYVVTVANWLQRSVLPGAH